MPITTVAAHSGRDGANLYRVNIHPLSGRGHCARRFMASSKIRHLFIYGLILAVRPFRQLLRRLPNAPA